MENLRGDYSTDKNSGAKSYPMIPKMFVKNWKYDVGFFHAVVGSGT